MTLNPYESPPAVEDETPPDSTSPPEKMHGSVMALVLATIGGGLAGTLVGNLVVLALGLGQFMRSFFEITNPLSLVLLIVGSLAAAYTTSRLTKRRSPPRTYRE